jgi:hypothetical protein
MNIIPLLHKHLPLQQGQVLLMLSEYPSPGYPHYLRMHDASE